MSVERVCIILYVQAETIIFTDFWFMRFGMFSHLVMIRFSASHTSSNLVDGRCHCKCHTLKHATLDYGSGEAFHRFKKRFKYPLMYVHRETLTLKPQKGKTSVHNTNGNYTLQRFIWIDFHTLSMLECVFWTIQQVNKMEWNIHGCKHSVKVFPI